MQRLLVFVGSEWNFFKRRAQSEAQKFLDEYVEIYKINSECKEKPPDEVFVLRQKMLPHFKTMREMALKQINHYSEKSKMYRAMNYFLTYYEGLTYCIKDPLVPLDNNSMESLDVLLLMSNTSLFLSMMTNQ